MEPKVFALVDCNNFYASCERLFRPDLRSRPIVVLSNNDGCVVARSSEAKAAGIPMAKPIFKLRDQIQAHQVQVFSSNYTLYGDLSNRVMNVLETFSPLVEPYSIDEAFIDLSGIDTKDYDSLGKKIQERIYQWTGIPISIGIATSKTLAKIAANLSKKSKKLDGVFSLVDSPYLERALKATPIEDVWGIGPGYAERLKAYQLETAWDLHQADIHWVRKKLTVIGQRTALELHGESCIPIDSIPSLRKSVITSRSFGKPVTALSDLQEAVTFYTSRCAEKLRKSNTLAKLLTVYARSGQYEDRYKSGKDSFSLTLPEATNVTPHLVSYAMKALEKIFEPGKRYKKAGVILTDLVSSESIQLSVFDEAPTQSDQRLMHLLDDLNEKMGKGKVFIAKEGVDKGWRMKSEMRSPNYTTNWQQIPEIEI
ncbi:MAG: Y-family DNA polymerase [Bacteroidota bacterium]